MARLLVPRLRQPVQQQHAGAAVRRYSRAGQICCRGAHPWHAIGAWASQHEHHHPRACICSLFNGGDSSSGGSGGSSSGGSGSGSRWWRGCTRHQPGGWQCQLSRHAHQRGAACWGRRVQAGRQQQRRKLRRPAAAASSRPGTGARCRSAAVQFHVCSADWRQQGGEHPYGAGGGGPAGEGSSRHTHAIPVCTLSPLQPSPCLLLFLPSLPSHRASCPPPSPPSPLSDAL